MLSQFLTTDLSRVLATAGAGALAYYVSPSHKLVAAAVAVAAVGYHLNTIASARALVSDTSFSPDAKWDGQSFVASDGYSKVGAFQAAGV